MALKEILVHLDATPRSPLRLKIAADLAAKHGAALVGLHSYDMPASEIFIGDPPMYFDATQVNEMLDRMRATKDEECRKLQTGFEAEVVAHGLVGEWRQVEGFATEVVSLHGRYADLVVVGQPSPDTGIGAALDPALLMGAGCPLLVIPYAGNYPSLGSHVLIGWNATAEAARAVADAMPLLQTAKKVTIVAINSQRGPQRGITADGEKPADDLARHLAHHGVKAESRQITATDISEGEALLSFAAYVGADLLVCGMYGHSRFREMAFGGVTRSLLIAMTVPSLLAH